MVKKIWKVIVVALTVLLGTVFSVGRPTVVHANETGTLQKRPSGLTFHAEFHHPRATQNTWTNDNVIYFINGEDVFCLDPTTVANAGAQYVGKVLDEAGNTTIPQNARTITLTPEKKERLMLLSYFGYLINPGSRAYHYTQFMIWEELGYAVQVISGDLSMAGYREFKASVNAKVSGYRPLTSWDGTSHTVKIGETLSLVDTNNVIQHLNIPAEVNGFKASVNGNTLNLTATANAANGELRFSQNANNKLYGASIVFTSPGSQTLGKLKLMI